MEILQFRSSHFRFETESNVSMGYADASWLGIPINALPKSVRVISTKTDVELTFNLAKDGFVSNSKGELLYGLYIAPYHGKPITIFIWNE